MATNPEKIQIKDLEREEVSAEELSHVLGGKVSMQDFHFVMRAAQQDVRTVSKVSMQDFHFVM